MRHPIRHLFRRALLLFAILFALDRLIGAGLEQSFFKQNHGDDPVSLYTLDSTQEDLLIFGSSRASHHYDSRLLAQLMNLSVYNCGRDEMGLSYAAAVVPIVLQRYTPKYIILELLPIELAARGKALSEQHISAVLLPFAPRFPALWPTVALVGKDQIYKAAISKIYPYNSLIGGIFQNTYTSFGHHTDRGYEPLFKTIDTQVYKKSIWESFDKSTIPDAALEARLADLLDAISRKGIKVFVVCSPFYFPHSTSGNESYEKLKAITERHGAHFMDFTADKRFLGQPQLFNDDVHLNDSGARMYSRIIADTLMKAGW
ncbi:MAG: hypothetical protein JST36_06520 [Bacteroidetes bacterium]|nr:hypothetical protein [Bacteroidota bacterium]